MHIVGLLLAVIVGAGVWYWRFKAVREMTDDIGNALGRAQGRYRMARFKKQSQGSALSSITDPALAAAIYLFSLANERDTSLHLSEPAIREQIGEIVPASDLDEVVSYARWAARETTDPRDIVRRFKPLWREKLTSQERAHLVAMAETIAAVGTGPDHNQKLSLANLRMALGPDQKR